MRDPRLEREPAPKERLAQRRGADPGTTSDDETVVRVLVNGREARPLAPDFDEWEITLSGPAQGETELTACAVDDSENVEERPHTMVVRMP